MIWRRTIDATLSYTLLVILLPLRIRIILSTSSHIQYTAGCKMELAAALDRDLSTRVACLICKRRPNDIQVESH